MPMGFIHEWDNKILGIMDELASSFKMFLLVFLSAGLYWTHRAQKVTTSNLSLKEMNELHLYSLCLYDGGSEFMPHAPLISGCLCIWFFDHLFWRENLHGAHFYRPFQGGEKYLASSILMKTAIHFSVTFTCYFTSIHRWEILRRAKNKACQFMLLNRSYNLTWSPQILLMLIRELLSQNQGFFFLLIKELLFLRKLSSDYFLERTGQE
ncbi:hypothetical protein ACJX0J_014086, partial [Zea mays]